MAPVSGTAASVSTIEEALLLHHECKTIPRDSVHLPGPKQKMINTGRLAGTGYVSILPVDQGIEHSAGDYFAPNPAYFDPENIVKLAIEGGCNAVASTLGVLGSVARKYVQLKITPVRVVCNNTLTLALGQGGTSVFDTTGT